MKFPMKLVRRIPRFLTATLFLSLFACFSAVAQSTSPDSKPTTPPQQPPAAAQQTPPTQPPAAQQAPPDSSSDMQPIPPSDSEKSEGTSEGNKSNASQPNTTPSTAPKSTPPPSLKSENSDDEGITIRRRVDEVNVVFTVTDRHGRYVRDLQRNDFKVLDDKKPATSIRSFSNQTDLPLEVGLLVDASNSVRDRFKFEQESAIQFLNQTIRPRYDKAFVIGFDVTPEVTQDFTDDTGDLSHGVRALRPGGGTAMYDALYYACRDKLAKSARTGPVRRAIILLSDGDDNQSHVSREEAIEMAQRAEVIVYTISTNISGMKGKGDKVLERIADATGGRAFFPFQIRDVANAFAEIQDELRSQYAISYRPADFAADGSYRTIEIVAQNHHGLHVRSRKGYFAPAQ
jgi:Ca-activated chloride channel homolog